MRLAKCLNFGVMAVQRAVQAYIPKSCKGIGGNASCTALSGNDNRGQGEVLRLEKRFGRRTSIVAAQRFSYRLLGRYSAVAKVDWLPLLQLGRFPKCLLLHEKRLHPQIAGRPTQTEYTPPHQAASIPP